MAQVKLCVCVLCKFSGCIKCKGRGESETGKGEVIWSNVCVSSESESGSRFQGGMFFSRNVGSSSTESDDCFKMILFFLSNRSSSSI